MIIKLQKEQGSKDYFIFENVKNVTYSNDLKAAPEAAFTLPDIFYYNSEPSLQKSSPRYLNNIECDYNGEHMRIWFDGEAFICNDDGKTIQRIYEVTSRVMCSPTLK